MFLPSIAKNRLKIFGLEEDIILYITNVRKILNKYER